LSRDDIFLSDIDYQCHLTTCAKLVINNTLIGVVCVDHINNSTVRSNYNYLIIYLVSIVSKDIKIYVFAYAALMLHFGLYI